MCSAQNMQSGMRGASKMPCFQVHSFRSYSRIGHFKRQYCHYWLFNNTLTMPNCETLNFITSNFNIGFAKTSKSYSIQPHSITNVPLNLSRVPNYIICLIKPLPPFIFLVQEFYYVLRTEKTCAKFLTIQIPRSTCLQSK